MNDDLHDASLLRGESPWWADVLQDNVLREDPPAFGDKAKTYDLEERVAKFGETVVQFAKRVRRHPANDRLVNQLVGAATSVGANYLEATEGVSMKDFRFPIARSKKEAKETKFFLRMIVASEPDLAATARPLYREAHELHLIFAAIHRKTGPEGKVQGSRFKGSANEREGMHVNSDP
jgi:four helix bundle protein